MKSWDMINWEITLFGNLPLNKHLSGNKFEFRDLIRSPLATDLAKLKYCHWYDYYSRKSILNSRYEKVAKFKNDARSCHLQFLQPYHTGQNSIYELNLEDGNKKIPDTDLCVDHDNGITHVFHFKGRVVLPIEEQKCPQMNAARLKQTLFSFRNAARSPPFCCWTSAFLLRRQKTSIKCVFRWTPRHNWFRGSPKN